MRKFLMIGVGVVVAFVVALLGVVAVQPSQVHVERSRVLAASPEQIWPHVADLERFVVWSPWTDRDPDQVSAFSSPASGVGAWYSWEGNDDVGTGRMDITAVDPQREVVQDLEFIEPFPSVAVVTLILEPVDGGTRVTWGFDTEFDFMGKAMSLVMDMDDMLGPDYELGLERLDGVVAASLAGDQVAER